LLDPSMANPVPGAKLVGCPGDTYNMIGTTL
jgi:hypothetical protein